MAANKELRGIREKLDEQQLKEFGVEKGGKRQIHTEPMSPRIAENQRMSTPNKKFVKSMIILGCNWLTVSKIKKQRESLVSLEC